MGSNMHHNFKVDILRFLLLLLVYALISNICIPLSERINIPNSLTAIGYVIFCVILLCFLNKKGELEYYGFKSLKNLNHKKLLFYIPMILIVSVNLLAGIHINDTLLQIVLISVCMLCVGFIEEVIFRSFLMKALMHKNDKLAIFVSGSLFGIIHLLNIFTGNNVFSTLLQVFYAMSFGLMCAIFFYKTKNIIPCILCHGISNMFDTFLPSDQTIVMQYIGCVLFILISGCYSIYLWKNHGFENR
jgi:membrane protease YdiL (CAAX protease family)